MIGDYIAELTVVDEGCLGVPRVDPIDGDVDPLSTTVLLSMEMMPTDMAMALAVM